jgi:membrane protein DedA with SNARE-associated domain
VVVVASAIDATGVPFPGRLLLITAGALAADAWQAGAVVLCAAAGVVAGDHALYLLGRFGGPKVLSLYCRWTMGSSQCVRKAHDYFRRFGGLTIVIGRFVTGVRLFASALAGAGAIRYVRFLAFEILGALLWAGIFVAVGHWLGGPAARALLSFGGGALLVVATVVPVAYLGYRMWRRRRHGPATVERPARRSSAR